MKKNMAAMLISMAAMLAMPMAYAEEGVARSIVTTAVVDREPVDDLDAVPASESIVVFFTDLRDMQGQTVKHVWMHGEEPMAEVSFEVGGARWRVWSSKNMMPEWHGDWTVQVVNGVGGVVAEKHFTYGATEGAGMGMEMDMETGGRMPMGEDAPMAEEAPMMDAAPADEENSGEGMAE